ncbi:MAG: dephospho-CoA kinase [Alphaproteobacteria bacterium]
MIILGLTGSIGMGKSTAAAMLRRMGLPIHDADASIHQLLGPGGAAVAQVEAAFPGCTVETPDGRRRVERPKLGAQVFGNPAALKRLEAILHPMVGMVKRRFLERASRRRARMVVLDIPLLFETDGDKGCDRSILVQAPPAIQAVRVLRRPGMTATRLAEIRARQMPDAKKRRRADFIVPTSLGRRVTLRGLHRVVRLLKDADGCHWPPRPVPRWRRRRP